ncbi:hypothetical protein GIB67_038846 [Kingdonia uniflora]|uniref:TITAN-like protein n=1 Tax=Kingdonia uniflora TaxID=39325 RepID=A0A7J7M0T4_9MAGN|nr:hypothetical protein GIB67_038846 [Kingdonia uniflora]
MEEKSKKRNPNFNNKKEMEFELCKVCKLNHNKGRRHNYFPNHIKSLSSFLSRFLLKISDLQFFLKNPILLPEHAFRNRIWCVFCDCDIEELDSSFACNNAIVHMASEEHLKSLKDFLWRYGGGMDRVDAFRVSETDLAKWQKKCTMLMSGAGSSNQRSYGPSIDIHDELSSINKDKNDKNAIHSYRSSISNGFLPLQDFTNERHQVLYSEVTEVAKVGAPSQDATSLNCFKDSQNYLIKNKRKCSVGWSHSTGGEYQVARLGNGETSDHGFVLQDLAHASPLVPEVPKANVHSGALPPWLETIDDFQPNIHANSSKKSGKSQKLNPNRVGAAWAEKRKIELEMEKRGEIVANNCDADWLPNFGRVWQSGSRKESKKQFGMEKQKMPKVEDLSETPLMIQPYISKRMVRFRTVSA